MHGRVNQPRDLVWNLEGFTSPLTATKFFEAFKGGFMVYSSSVQKLYCEYTTSLTGPEGRRRMVLLPDFNQYEAIFNHIDDSAIVETSLIVYPRVKDGRTQIMVRGTATGSGKKETLTLKAGLKAAKMGYFEQGALIPVLMLGDLREFPELKLPYLSVHHVDLNRIDRLSEFEKTDIKRSAWLKFDQFI